MCGANCVNLSSYLPMYSQKVMTEAARIAIGPSVLVQNFHGGTECSRTEQIPQDYLSMKLELDLKEQQIDDHTCMQIHWTYISF